MSEQEEQRKRAEALRSIYRARGEELGEVESAALGQHLGDTPARAAIICVVLIVSLVAFLVWRFLL
jgi:hypothetical protein